MRILSIIFCLFFVNYMLAQQQTIYIVRHAEKDVSDLNVKDPNLSVEGKKRAKHLNHLLRNKKIEIAYSTPYKRTIQTLTPLVDSKKIELIKYNDHKILVSNIIDSNKNSIVAGHSNTILDIARQFGVKINMNEVSEDDYSNLIIIKMRDKKNTVKIKKYNHR